MPELIAFAAGLALGALGTLIGAGGGFVLVPLLVLTEPRWTTDQVTAFSLAVVTANAGSGAVNYWLQRRVDLRSFPLFAAAAVPGAIAGAFVTTYLPRRVFDPILGGVLIAIGCYLFLRPRGRAAAVVAHGGLAERELTDADGHHYRWSFDLRIGLAGSAAVGFFSSVLGIGGGIIHVPLLAGVLGFPAHIATATSHAVLAVTSAVATLVHVVRGDYRDDWSLVLACSGGALLGAPLGAALSRRVSGATILRVLAVALAFVGARLLVAH